VLKKLKPDDNDNLSSKTSSVCGDDKDKGMNGRRSHN